jgi:hypothetical protein
MPEINLSPLTPQFYSQSTVDFHTDLARSYSLFHIYPFCLGLMTMKSSVTSIRRRILWTIFLLFVFLEVGLWSLRPNQIVDETTLSLSLCDSQTVNDDNSGSCTIDLEFRRRSIVFHDITFDTPRFFFLFPVQNATIVSSGLVYNATDFYHLGKWYFEKEVGKHSLHSRPLPVEGDEYISIVQIWQDSFQHLSFDTYPRAVYMCEFLMQYQGYKIVAMGTLQIEIFRLACELPSSRFRIYKNSFSARTIYIPTFEKSYPMGIYSEESIKSAGPQLNQGDLVIYMPRSKGRRDVENEREVIEVLLQIFGRKLYICHPTDAWTDQIQIFSEAQIIIGPHGGAFGNMILAPVNTTVIEFHDIRALMKARENSRPCYLGLAHALGFTYYNFEPQNFTFGGSMWIDTTKLREFLQVVKHDLSSSDPKW